MYARARKFGGYVRCNFGRCIHESNFSHCRGVIWVAGSAKCYVTTRYRGGTTRTPATAHNACTTTLSSQQMGRYVSCIAEKRAAPLVCTDGCCSCDSVFSWTTRWVIFRGASQRRILEPAMTAGAQPRQQGSRLCKVKQHVTSRRIFGTRVGSPAGAFS